MTKSLKHAATIMANFQGKKSPFIVYPSEWQGSLMRFYFEDEGLKNSGVIDFQAAVGQVKIETNQPYTQFATTEAANQYLLSIVRTFIKFYHFGWSPTEAELPKYDAAYFEKSGYLNPAEHELQVKAFQAQTICDLAKPQKALVAGCASGELVRQLRLKNVEAFGFDILPDLENHTLPEVKGFLKSGSVQKIPFETADNFDTYILVDVLEHIPERDVEKLVSEALRLGFKKIVTLINHNQFNFEGHVTLRPLTWWQAQFGECFKMTDSFQLEEETLYANDDDFNHCWRVWENSATYY